MKRSKKVKKEEILLDSKDTVLSLDLFLDFCVFYKKINPWQKPEIKSFFTKNLDLKDKEYKDVYEKALKKY